MLDKTLKAALLTMLISGFMSFLCIMEFMSEAAVLVMIFVISAILSVITVIIKFILWLKDIY